MGKEVKIGLSIIGILLVVFGTLLARRLMKSDAPTVVEPGETALATRATDKPQVVTASRDADPAAAGISRGMWSGGSQANDTGADANEAPRASYLPDDSASAAAPATDRYGRSLPADSDIPDATPADEPARTASSGNPFQRTQATEPIEDAASPDEPQTLKAEPEDARGLQPRPVARPRAAGNPLRRTSAEEPVDASALTLDEPSAEMSAPEEAVDVEPRAVEPAEEEAPIETAPEPAATIEPEEPAPQSRYRSVPSVEEPVARPTSSSEPVAPKGKYTVQPSDTLWTISEKVYGTGRYFKAIAEHNKSRYPHPDRLSVGMVLDVPPVAMLEQNYPSLVPKQRKSAVVTRSRNVQASARQRVAGGGNRYVVEEGDTLFDIARYELGKASRWAEIYDLNRETLGEDFDYLQPGTELIMPAKGPADLTTRQRDESYQR